MAGCGSGGHKLASCLKNYLCFKHISFAKGLWGGGSLQENLTAGTVNSEGST